MSFYLWFLAFKLGNRGWGMGLQISDNNPVPLKVYLRG